MENNKEEKLSPLMLAIVTQIEAIGYCVKENVDGAIAKKHHEQKQKLIGEIKKISDERDKLLQQNFALTNRLLELTAPKKSTKVVKPPSSREQSQPYARGRNVY